MDDTPANRGDGLPVPSQSRRRTLSTPPNSGLLSKLPFMRASGDPKPRQENLEVDSSASAPARSLAAAVQQTKTRRRRGSLRKVALLGRGAQRDKRDSRSTSGVGTGTGTLAASVVPEAKPSGSAPEEAGEELPTADALGLSVADPEPETELDRRPNGGGYASRSNPAGLSISMNNTSHRPEQDVGLPNVYASTTDEEDMLQIPQGPAPSRPGLHKSPGSESYFNRDTTQLPRSFQQAKSPLSYSGLSSTPLAAADSDWDYSETAWWGWVLLCVTWFVFVIGMGSCLGVWSWAWDVGKTPYAPPELEDDPTLPLVGYYPALIILTGVMAWVWVVVAWVGMKYFRHAKISGD